ncbi:hypothetical protein LSH36_455g07052 [Paralvinella palmiformis]|uniref:CRAL-TRIO domain-containing protein n=1 Tax=Paralvinella palmiformis TaxID=53620 RepID=A0AAD9MZD7_9ANNE|nr:hypothetical protein LSH36_455g07052 [Paralvinella palmiformis]
MSQDEDYVCTLDETTITKAIKELHEDPKDRLSSVNKFRDWILEQEHIKCRTAFYVPQIKGRISHELPDTAFLLLYLRGAKFSQLRARELLENTMRAMTELPRWFKTIDTREPGVLEYFKLGVSFPLPKRDPMNRKILIIRPGAISVKNQFYSFDNEMRSAYCEVRLISMDEVTQVYGYILIFDFSGFTAKHAKASWSSESFKKQSKVWQDCTPGRVKAFHVYNGGIFFEMMMTLAKPFMKKKFQQRFHVHDNLESLYKHIPKECLPHEYVPDDFTDHVGSVQEIIDSNVSLMTSDAFRQEIINSTKPEYGMDLTLKPSGPAAESFRKLTLD